MKPFSGQKSLSRSENRAGNWMTLIPFLGFLLFGAIPILISFVLSFMKLNTYDMRIAGTGSYAVTKSKIWHVLWMPFTKSE